jgi:cobaltochelatase CobN
LDVFVKDKYHLGLRRFFQEQNPHARQTVLARLLEVDRQQIQRFSAGDRTMLLTEYARSVTHDGAACNAQVCGNAVLRQHVAHELRQRGGGSQASNMEAAFRRTLTKQAPVVVTRKVAQARVPVVEWKTLAKYTIAWTKHWPQAWNFKAVPWWAWVGGLCGYAAAAGLLARKRQTFAVETINLLGPSRAAVEHGGGESSCCN